MKHFFIYLSLFFMVFEFHVFGNNKCFEKIKISGLESIMPTPCEGNLIPVNGNSTYSSVSYPFTSAGTIVSGVDYYNDIHNQNVSGTTSGWYFDSHSSIGILDGSDFINSNIIGNVYAATASNACAYHHFGNDLTLDPALTYCISLEFAYLGKPGINWGDPAFVRMLVQFDDFDGVNSHTQVGSVYGWSPSNSSTTILNAGGRHATKLELENETNWQTEVVYTLTAADITNINTGNTNAISFHVSTSMGLDAYIYVRNFYFGECQATTADYFCPPTANLLPTATAHALAASCTNGTPNDDAYLQISTATDATHYNFVAGSDYTSGDADIANATAFDPATDVPLQFGTLANPVGSQDYTIRLFNSTSDDFTDMTITVMEQDCMAGCSCKEMLYLNDTGTGEVHKFGVNTDGSIYEIGSPWMSGFSNPHGLGSDINGFLYIGDDVTGPIYQLTCDGGTVANDASLWNTDFNDGMTNIGSYGGYIFVNGTTTNGQVSASEIGVIDACTGTLVGEICLDGFVWGNWGMQILPDGKIVATAGANWGDGNRAIYIFDFDETLINNTNCIAPLVSSSYLDNYDGLYGITYDGTHLYVVTLENGTSELTLLKIDATTGALVLAQAEGGWNSSGYNGAQGLVYAESSGMLYVAGYEDCVSIVNPADLSYVGPGNGVVATGELPKAISILKECCPTPNRQTINQTYCVSGSNEQLFLNELFPCDGVICEGQWIASDAVTTGVYNSCDQSISAGIPAGCYSFTKGSEGTGNNPQCGAFQLEFNLEILEMPSIAVSADQTICVGEMPAEMSITTTATTIQWQMSTTSCTDGFTNIDGETAATYTPAALSQTTYYRALITETANCSTGNCSFESDCITVNINAVPNLSIDGATCDAGNTTYTIDFTSDGTVTSTAGTVSGNQIIDIPVGTDATITTELNGCSTQETVVSPTCEPNCSPLRCVKVTLTKTN